MFIWREQKQVVTSAFEETLSNSDKGGLELRFLDYEEMGKSSSSLSSVCFLVIITTSSEFV